MRVALLGCAGFIGSHLTEWLLDNTGCEVIGTDIVDDKIRHLRGRPRFTYHHSDLRSDEALTRRLVAESDVVVNLVAIASPAQYTRDPLHVFELDFLENLKVVGMCSEMGTRLVQFSTCEIYGKTWLSQVPGDAMGAAERDAADVSMREDETQCIVGPVHKSRWIYSTSKQLLERVIHAHGEQRGLDYTIVRPFNFVGPRFDFLPSAGGDDSPRLFAQFMSALIHGGEMRLVDGGEALRSWVYIDDAVDCIGRMIIDRSGASSRQAFNVGNPANEMSVAELAELMFDLYTEHYWDGASPLARIVTVPHEEMFGEGYDDCDRRVPDVSKARALLGWQPSTPLLELVTRTMDAFVADYRASVPEPSAPLAR